MLRYLYSEHGLRSIVGDVFDGILHTLYNIAHMHYLFEDFQWPPTRLEQPLPPTHERWNGTVHDAIVDLGRLTMDDYRRPSDERLWDETIWHPSRVLAAVIKATGRHVPRVREITQLTNFTKNLYIGNACSADIDTVREITQRFGITQKDAYLWIDDRTLTATNPALSREAAKRLQTLPHQNLCMVPLGNGGFTASILTALEYRRMTGQELPIYPVRFSRNKSYDYEPFATNEELTHLATISQGRTTVVFDEDTTSGQTINEAVNYFRSKLPNRAVVGLANSDKRSSSILREQGIWWEGRQSMA